jgi:hypothetical protein
VVKQVVQWFRQKIFRHDVEPRYLSNINYRTLFTPQNLAMLSDWLSETGELYVNIEYPHSGGSGSSYFIRSMTDLKTLIVGQTHGEIDITIFHEKQFPLRGIADEQLLEQALRMIPDGELYQYVSLEDSVFPKSIAVWGSGVSHEEFRQEFAEDVGKHIAVGQNPHDIHLNDEWFDTHLNEVLRVTYLLKDGKITRNQDDYAPYNTSPEKYEWVIQLWQSED